MPGVMDINHLLCHPIIHNKPDFNYHHQHSPLSSDTSLPTLFSSQHHHQVLPLPANFDNEEFWQHNRSMSTASVASNTSTCTTNSNHSNGIHSFSPPTDQRQTYRRRVNSESDTKFIAYPNHHQQRQKPASTKRARANSASSLQTRTPWTPSEDDLLQKGYQQGLSWAMISCTFLPHRSRGCCWGRFKTLQSKNAIEVYQQRICQRPWKAHYKK